MTFRQQRIYLLILPIIIVGLSWKYSINFPNADDFDVFIDFLLTFHQQPIKLFELLTSSHNEHVLLVPRLFALLIYFTLGQLNFVLLTTLGVIGLIPLAILLIKVSDKIINPFPVIASLSILFTPIYGELLSWPTAATQGIWVYCFALLAIISAEKRKFILCLVFIAISSLTQGNGILCGLACSVMFWSNGLRSKGILLGVCTILTLALLGSNHKTSISDPSAVASYAFALLGNIGLNFTLLQSQIFGAVVLVIALLLLFSALRKKFGPLEALLLFLLLSVAANAVARHALGASFAIQQSRYVLLTLLTFSSILLIAAKNLPNSKIITGISCLGLLIIPSLWNEGLKQLEYRSYVLAQSMIKWDIDSVGLEYPNAERATKLLTDTINNGIYSPAAMNLLALESKITNLNIPPPDSPGADDITYLRINLKEPIKGKEYYYFSGVVNSRISDGQCNEVEIILSGVVSRFKLSAFSAPFPDSRTSSGRLRPLCLFYAILHKNSLPPDSDWKVGVIANTNQGNIVRLDTGKRIS